MDWVHEFCILYWLRAYFVTVRPAYQPSSINAGFTCRDQTSAALRPVFRSSLHHGSEENTQWSEDQMVSGDEKKQWNHTKWGFLSLWLGFGRSMNQLHILNIEDRVVTFRGTRRFNRMFFWNLYSVRSQLWRSFPSAIDVLIVHHECSFFLLQIVMPWQRHLLAKNSLLVRAIRQQW